MLFRLLWQSRSGLPSKLTKTIAQRCPALAMDSAQLRRRVGDEDGSRFDRQTARGCDLAFSRHGLSELCIAFDPPEDRRAQGKPGADCTHGPGAAKSTGVGPQV